MTLEPLGITLNNTVADLRAAIRAKQAAFETAFREKLADNDVTVDPIPSIDHATVFGCAMQERQPFKDTGEGYRDALTSV